MIHSSNVLMYIFVFCDVYHRIQIYVYFYKCEVRGITSIENSFMAGVNRERNFRRKNFNNTHIRRKRPALKLSKAENVIYVNSKSHVKAFLSRCEKLINRDFEEIVLYCMGSSISKGICLALELCEKYPSYQYHCNTFTSQVTDDLEPTVDDADYGTEKRNKSALEIKLFKVNQLKTKETA